MPFHEASGFSAYVTTSGPDPNHKRKDIPVQEYNTQQQLEGDVRVVTSFIAAETGKEFGVQWTNVKNLGNHQATRGTLVFDGNTSVNRTLVLRHGTKPKEKGRESLLEGEYFNDWKVLRPFKFGSLERIGASLDVPFHARLMSSKDDNEQLDGSETRTGSPHHDLGVIELTIDGGRAGRQRRKRPAADCRIVQHDIEIQPLVLNERVKDSEELTQQVLLGEPLDVPADVQRQFRRELRTTDPNWYKKDENPDAPGPLVVFRFVYRPLEILRAQGINILDEDAWVVVGEDVGDVGDIEDWRAESEGPAHAMSSTSSLDEADDAHALQVFSTPNSRAQSPVDATAKIHSDTESEVGYTSRSRSRSNSPPNPTPELGHDEDADRKDDVNHARACAQSRADRIKQLTTRIKQLAVRFKLFAPLYRDLLTYHRHWQAKQADIAAQTALATESDRRAGGFINIGPACVGPWASRLGGVNCAMRDREAEEHGRA
uniref:DUF7918 domain-containing protein n=1 Tax=Mycena chlorophos TaxID=658473 RepID=A0ABQ0LXQ5_MYCCL|nr:predicted protein [Mycena chlorophos]